MGKYKKSNETFVNPYHFVPLEDKCDKSINFNNYKNEKGLFTGYVECTLETLTPIFIPNTTNDDFFKEKDAKDNKIKSYDFYSYEDLSNQDNNKTFEPVIPGSSIRGTIRSVFEALTNSCMSAIDDEQVLYKRVTTAAKPGRLVKENGKWKIYECERYGVAVKSTNQDKMNFFQQLKNFKDGEEIFFSVGGTYYKELRYKKIPLFKFVSKISNKKFNNCKTGYLHLGEPFGRRKHHESIFVPKNKNSIEIDEKYVKNLLENYKLYQNDKINLHKKQGEHKGYKSNIKNAENSNINELDGSLIYYAEHNGKYYLCPAAIGREIFENRVKDLIGSYTPCYSYSKLCPACALFGFAGKDDALGSRVRFSDAKVINKEYRFLSPTLLPELASPKPSAAELYLKKPKQNVDLWNYDYAGKWERHNFKSIEGYQPKIQGRKFYWHQENIKTFESENQKYSKKVDKSDRLVMVRPIDKGSKFKFKIHFNRIKKQELDKLLWVLSLGNNKDLAHKIGMGKPVGLGSIKISIDCVKQRKIKINNDNLKYELADYNCDFSQVNLGCNKIVKESFEKIANFKNNPKNVNYPYCKENNKILPEHFHWFVGNKQVKEGSTGTKPIISEHLRPVTDNYKLCVIEITKDKKTNNKNRRKKW